MHDLATAFVLGNAAILGNVCVLPLYPGLVALLGGSGTGRAGWWVGAPVLAGVVVSMVGIGLALHLVGRSVADVLGWLLPLVYASVLVLGVALLAGANPFARLSAVRAPVLGSPAGTAFAYGALLAPMTLPCTGPLIVSAFVLGGVAGADALADALAYAVAFALGFGWPLLVLPVLAAPLRRRAVLLPARTHRLVELGSGVLLVAIAIVGWWTAGRPAA